MQLTKRVVLVLGFRRTIHPRKGVAWGRSYDRRAAVHACLLLASLGCDHQLERSKA
jgi:hypothetical protein